MLVTSQLFFISQPAVANANDPLVGWENLVTTTTVAADTENASYPGSNVANPSTNNEWRAADDQLVYLTATVDRVEPIDYVGVAKHNLGSTNIAVSIETQAEAEGVWVEAVAPVLLGDDSPAVLRFEPVSVYAVRLKMVPPSGVIPQISVVYAGKLLVMQRRFYVGHTPMKYGRRVSVATGRSESGNYLGRIVVGHKRETTAPFANIDPAWYRANMDPFIEAALDDTPFFFVWRPFTYPREVGYAWLSTDVTPVNSRPNGMMDVTLPLQGIV